MAAAAKGVELRDCPPHTAAKHVLLSEYLGGWFPIMASWAARLIYLDPFAAAGEYLGNKDGSPIIALKTLIDHQSFDAMGSTDFVFLLNDSHQGCVEHLEGCIARLEATRDPWPANVKVAVENSTFVEVTTGLLDTLEARGARLAPTFAFIDPVGVKHTPMAVLQRLSAMPKVEMLVYFAHEAVVRHGESEEFAGHLDALFGDDDYLLASDLEGEEKRQFLHDLYARKLRQHCDYAYVQSFAMHNAGGNLAYYLFFCTRSLKGFDLMKKAMWKVAPEGDFQFRDRYAGYDVLFNRPVDTTAVQAEMCAHFAGRTAAIKEVEDWFVGSTPFHSSHLRKFALQPMQTAGVFEVHNQGKAGTYPDRVLLTFPPIEVS